MIHEFLCPLQSIEKLAMHTSSQVDILVEGIIDFLGETGENRRCKKLNKFPPFYQVNIMEVMEVICNCSTVMNGKFN